MTPVGLPHLGDVIADKYELIERLGSGAFGAVYKARQLGIDRDVALKVLLPDAEEATSAARSRFQREARLSASLSHPNTITLYDYGSTESGLLYLAMEYIRGETLKGRLRRVGSLSEPEARRITLQILASLQEAHSRGIVHRDLKPGNIMLFERLGESDVVKVVDFGIAKFVSNDDQVARGEQDGDDLTLEGRIVGTPRYMAPEQIRGEAVDAGSDLYAVGLLLYEMIAGQPAITGDTTLMLITRQVSEESAVSEADEAVSPTMLRVIRRATAKDPSARFASAADFIAVLEDPTSLASEASESDDALPTQRRGRLGVWVGVAIIVVLLGIGVIIGAIAATHEPTPSASAAQLTPKAASDEVDPDNEEVASPKASEAVESEVDKELPPMREVVLESDPSNALVTRDGMVIGKTPVTLALEEGQTPSLEVSLQGFETVTVAIGEDPPEEVVLTPVKKPERKPPKRRTPDGKPAKDDKKKPDPSGYVPF